MDVGYLNFVHSMQRESCDCTYARGFVSICFHTRERNKYLHKEGPLRVEWGKCSVAMASLPRIDGPRRDQPKAKQNEAAVTRHGDGKWNIHDHGDEHRA
jgi:hypothetical protein